MNRLFKLSDKKDKLKKKLVKIESKIEKINKEALSFKGESIIQDMVIECIVFNKQFVPMSPRGNKQGKRHLEIIK